MKKVIGIVTKGVLFDMEKSNMNDLYHLGNNYIKRITEAGGIPMGLAPVDGRISQEQMEMCDGFIVQGGTQMWPYHIQVVHHAVTTGKKYLGICLGMQLIHRYYKMRKMVADMGLEDPVEELTVNAWATDGTGTIEGIENGSNILGVQFHPEVDDLLPEIFRFLMEE